MQKIQDMGDQKKKKERGQGSEGRINLYLSARRSRVGLFAPSLCCLLGRNPFMLVEDRPPVTRELLVWVARAGVGGLASVPGLRCANEVHHRHVGSVVLERWRISVPRR